MAAAEANGAKLVIAEVVDVALSDDRTVKSVKLGKWFFQFLFVSRGSTWYVHWVLVSNTPGAQRVVSNKWYVGKWLAVNIARSVPLKNMGRHKVPDVVLRIL